jgi:hypothetical protein
MAQEGIMALEAYVADEVPHLRLRLRGQAPWQPTVHLTYHDPTNGRQYYVDVHEDFYLDRDAAVIRRLLDTWNLAAALREGRARRLRIHKETFEIVEYYP